MWGGGKGGSHRDFNRNHGQASGRGIENCAAGTVTRCPCAASLWVLFPSVCGVGRNGLEPLQLALVPPHLASEPPGVGGLVPVYS